MSYQICFTFSEKRRDHCRHWSLLRNDDVLLGTRAHLNSKRVSLVYSSKQVSKIEMFLNYLNYF